MHSDFTLDARLATDTGMLGDAPLCRVLLMRNRLFPWLVLVPRVAGAVEIHRLDLPDQRALLRETMAAGRLLDRLYSPDKINIGALGNIVPQLHVHIIARRQNDAAWPGPVWGSGKSAPYNGEEWTATVQRLWAELQHELSSVQGE